MEEEAEFCHEVAESVGLGFEIPKAKAVETTDVAAIAPKIAVQEETV